MNLDLFEEAVPPMVRTPDTATAHMAKDKVKWGAQSMRNYLLQQIGILQPVTALELEEQPAFETLAPSTVRKRVSELKAQGKIVAVGVHSYTTKSGRVAKGEAYRVTLRVMK